jgi:hypothetical protein
MVVFSFVCTNNFWLRIVRLEKKCYTRVELLQILSTYYFSVSKGEYLEIVSI